MKTLRNSQILRTIPLLLVVVILCPFAYGKVIYVDDDATGTNDGTSWENAYAYLQDALADANSAEKPVEIRVAQGIYKPNLGLVAIPELDWRTATFQLINSVTLKGGFAGLGQPDPNARDIELYETILSGDLNSDDVEIADPCDLIDEPTRADNSYHILTCNKTDSNTVVDGFTITGGNANGPEPSNYGGGLYNLDSDLMLINCNFHRNTAISLGGAIYNSGGLTLFDSCMFECNHASGGGAITYRRVNSKLVNCIFRNNSSLYWGGALQSYGQFLELVDCIFIDNSAGQNGGSFNSSSVSATLVGCSFIANKSGDGGGAIINQTCNAKLTNCIFIANYAKKRGGAIFSMLKTDLNLTNCTFHRNISDRLGGSLSNSYSQATIRNCIMLDNWAPNGTEISLSQTDYPSNVSVAYSNIRHGEPAIHIEDGCTFVWSDGNIDADPLFANPGYWNPNGTPHDSNDDYWVDGDYHLKSQAGRWDPNSQTWVADDVTSPCIDAGDPNIPVEDEPFPNGGRINMGAYGGTAEASKSAFHPVAGTSTYVFLPDQSTVVQTGGIVGVHWTYSIEGQFELTVNRDAGTALFANIDANAIDDSPYKRTLDPNEVFNMTELIGTVVGDTAIVFTGKADDSDVLIVAILNDDLISLFAQTYPPADSADFFVFNMDAVAQSQSKYGGGTGESNDPYLIYTAEHLNAIGAEPNDWDKHFVLMADIDLSGFTYDAALIAPDIDPCDLAFQGTSFTGVFDGNGHTITHMTITGEHYLGLFGQLEFGAEIRNLGVVDVNISGSQYVGALAGFNEGTIMTSYVTGAVRGEKRVGGLTGRNWRTITQSYNAATVTGNDDVGGLAAANYGSITASYNAGAIVANWDAGGLVGENYRSIAASYSTGTVTGVTRAGGLVGYNYPDSGTVTGCFWDMEGSGQATSDGGTSKTTAEMQTASTFLEAGWDFVGETANGTEDIWWILEGKDYPRLWWESPE